MRSTRVVLSAAALLATAAAPLSAGAAPAAARTVRMQASDFRFCATSAPACSPGDDGSLTARPAPTFVWVNTDYARDAAPPCPGHNVVFSSRRYGSQKL